MAFPQQMVMQIPQPSHLASSTSIFAPSMAFSSSKYRIALPGHSFIGLQIEGWTLHWFKSICAFIKMVLSFVLSFARAWYRFYLPVLILSCATNDSKKNINNKIIIHRQLLFSGLYFIILMFLSDLLKKNFNHIQVSFYFVWV